MFTVNSDGSVTIAAEANALVEYIISLVMEDERVQAYCKGDFASLQLLLLNAAIVVQPG